MRNVRGLALRVVVAGLMVAVGGSAVALHAQEKKKHDAPTKDTTTSSSKTKTTSTNSTTKTSTTTGTKPTVARPPAKDSKSGDAKTPK